eukprot:TRINITY_DN725_c0_g1_i1.p1 TRINITY_DN725_c0_g1~~TRINITY_DN725_c0_g1_i1.p1  ORF type:complete len:161 (-),score=33.09 TRINITY_DN725_c0_g1_i1:23-505(-)
MSVQISPQVAWGIIKHQNRFLIKQKTEAFSSDPLNLTNLHRFAYNGLAKKQAIGLRPEQGGKKGAVVLSVRRRILRRPASDVEEYPLRKDFRRQAQSVRRILKNVRPDLVRVALARLTKINRSLKPLRPLKKKVHTSKRKSIFRKKKTTTKPSNDVASTA